MRKSVVISRSSSKIDYLEYLESCYKAHCSLISFLVPEIASFKFAVSVRLLGFPQDQSLSSAFFKPQTFGSPCL